MSDNNDSATAGLLAHRVGDAVAVAVRDLAPGEVQVAFLDDGERRTVTLGQEVPLGHKVALADIAEGGDVIEYGQRIGLARQAMSTGDYVHVHNLRSARWQPAS